MKTPSQYQNPAKVALIREHFLAGNSLTSFEAFYAFGVTRLAAIVHKLSAEGWVFDRVREEYSDSGSGFTTFYVRYSLNPDFLATIPPPKTKMPLAATKGTGNAYAK